VNVEHDKKHEQKSFNCQEGEGIKVSLANNGPKQELALRLLEREEEEKGKDHCS
jgi:hypothetical protein